MTPPRRRFAVVAIAALTADLATKAWASRSLDRPVELIGSLSLQLSHNPGVAFGVGRSLPTGVLLAFTGLICVAIALAGWTGALYPASAVGLIVGGAVANLLDRLEGGTVVDMIHLTWWPTFNLADVAICTGAGLVVLATLLPEPRSAHTVGTADRSTS